MSEYHKIQTVYKRDPATKYKTLLEGDFSLPEFEYLARNNWLFTEKVDGTNIRAYYNLGAYGEVSFYGRTDKAQIPDFLRSALEETVTPKQLASVFGEESETVILHGEGFGPKIQKGGGRYRNTPGFVLFDVNINGSWLERHNVVDIAEKLALPVVPAIGSGTLYDAVEIAREGLTSMWGDFQAEGIVARPVIELRTRRGERLITKIKCKDFV